MSLDNLSNTLGIHLPYLSVISITGIDSEKLLQGQSSCDVTKLKETHSALGTLSTAKGKMYANFLLLKKPDSQGFLMVLHQTIVEHVVKQLNKYAVFYQCNIEACENLYINTKEASNSNQLNVSIEQNTFNIHWLNQQTLSISDQKGRDCTFDIWQSDEYTAGWFWLTNEASEAYTAPMLNMDKLNAISFEKGCYTGQEVIARTHYKGTLKKRLQLLSSEEQIDTEFKQQIIDANDKNIGQVISSLQSGNKTYIFALLKLDSDTILLPQSNDNKKLQIENLPYTVE